ncbi:alpha/beta hydrolase [Acidovorax sp. NCPPB 2350]|nr:alpha/beta hydrolase [Acidovorax sp. NCPPB 2350]
MNTPPSDDESPSPPRDLWIDHPRGRLFARHWSPAQAQRALAPIVLFHDSLGCVDLWRSLPARLCEATARPVIAYDRLGFGRSAARAGRPPLDFIAEEAREFFPALRGQLGIGRFVALGHSVGGGMAIECAARFARDCEALVTIAAQVFPEERTLAGIRQAREQFRDPAQVQRLMKYHGDKAPWVLDAWIERWLDPAFAPWSLAGVLPGVACPVLAIHGGQDEYGSTRHPRRIGELAAGAAEVAILPGAGHVPHREDEPGLLALVARFLAGTAGPAAR